MDKPTDFGVGTGDGTISWSVDLRTLRVITGVTPTLTPRGLDMVLEFAHISIPAGWQLEPVKPETVEVLRFS